MKKQLVFISLIAGIALVFWSFSQATVQPGDKGVGPIKEVKLGPLNHQMANEGKSIFSSKCIACHSLDQKVVGP
ncbi:MAG TPA: hypothetical protein VIH57_16805, partial [Bacteroidales bacterium]